MEALQIGKTTWRHVPVTGIVKKVEHWSETHVRGSAPRLQSTAFDGANPSLGGSLSLSGGGVSSTVVNRRRLYLETDGPYEEILVVPGDFPAREEQTITAHYLSGPAESHLIKVTNKNTGNWITTGYNGSGLVRLGFLEAIGMLIRALAVGWAIFFTAIFGYSFITDFSNITSGRGGIPFWFTLLFALAVVVLLPSIAWWIGSRFSRNYRRNRKALKNYLAAIEAL